MVSILCFAFIIKIVPFNSLDEVITQGRPMPLLIVCFLMLPAVLIRAWRWHFILKRKKIHVSATRICRATFIGMALNLLLPASGGDVARSYFGWRSEGHKEAMLASAIADKVVALFTLFVLGTISGFILGLTKIAIITMVLTIPLAWIIFVPWRLPWLLVSTLSRRIIKKELHTENLLKMFKMDLQTFGGCFIISLIGWTVTNLMYYYACFSFTSNASILYIFSIAPLINLMRVLPITISGLGSADALIVYLYTYMNVSKAEALAASMTINITLIALPGLVGAIMLILEKDKEKKKRSKSNRLANPFGSHE